MRSERREGQPVSLAQPGHAPEIHVQRVAGVDLGELLRIAPGLRDLAEVARALQTRSGDPRSGPRASTTVIYFILDGDEALALAPASDSDAVPTPSRR